ncbi:MAG: efflux RND transporter periplasmic adaptor subunit [Sphaerochaetaceae bacterium]|nr:efflux RND transporter periplasmic adaptor subunit [Sphaerochaetaceae bacterium]
MSRRPLFTVLRYIFLIILVGLIGFAAFLLLGTREKTVYNAPLPPVVIASPISGNLEKSLMVSGTIQAESLIAVIPFVAGTIETYHVAEGDVIEENTVIATIDSEPYRQQVAQAQAAYVVSQATFERIDRLYAAKAATLQSFEQAKAQRDAARSQLELAQLQLGHADVAAPITGTVISIPLAKGNVASNQQPVAIMADLNSLIIDLNISERYYDIIRSNKDNLQVKVSRTSAYGESVEALAAIVHISSYIQPQSKTFAIRCRLTEGYGLFSPGMHVSVQLVYESYLDVPLLRQSDRTIDQNVYIYEPDTQSAKWQALVPIAENDQFFIVPEELASYQFIVDGLHTVFDGQSVTVVDVRRE